MSAIREYIRNCENGTIEPDESLEITPEVAAEATIEDICMLCYAIWKDGGLIHIVWPETSPIKSPSERVILLHSVVYGGHYNIGKDWMKFSSHFVEEVKKIYA